MSNSSNQFDALRTRITIDGTAGLTTSGAIVSDLSDVMEAATDAQSVRMERGVIAGRHLRFFFFFQ